MLFEELLNSENTNDRYDLWKNYREDLTEKIINNFNDILIKKKVKEEKIRRVKDKQLLHQIKDQKGYKPTLAIWGAGGCNDIDIVALSHYFTLILIDDNEKQIKGARSRAKLSESECVCTNLKFWDVWEEEYYLFDALVKDRAPVEDIVIYFDDLVNRMIEIDYSTIPTFDFSVCVGLASQLNSRFMAILYRHKGEPDFYSNNDILTIVDAFDRLNDIAVERMCNCINKLTKYGAMFGYELDSLFIDETDESNKDVIEEIIREKLNEINSVIEESIHIETANEKQNIWQFDINIQGSKQLEKYLMKCELDNPNANSNLICTEALVWPFAIEKSYIMIFRTIDNL